MTRAAELLDTLRVHAYAHAQTLTAAVPLHLTPSAAFGNEQDEWFPLLPATRTGRGPHAPRPALSHEGGKEKPDSRAAPLAVLGRWHGPKASTVVVLMHGIGGSDQSLYVQRAKIAFAEWGYRVLGLNQRGAGTSIPRADRLYHAGLTDDVRSCLHVLQQRPDIQRIFLVGFSGGGALALKYAAEEGDNVASKLGGIAALSAPLDLTKTVQSIARWDRAPYRFHVLRGLIRGARRFRFAFPDDAPYTFPELLRVRSIPDFDRTVTIRFHGYESTEHYYAEQSAGPTLGKLTTQSLLIHADDDPMVPQDAVWPALRGAPKVLHAERYAKGGHLGFIGGFSRNAWVFPRSLTRIHAFFSQL
jgi:uncharacterized protein